MIATLGDADSLLEVGIGNRPGVARELSTRGCAVVAIDLTIGERTRETASAVPTSLTEISAHSPGSVRVVEADIHTLVQSDRNSPPTSNSPSPSGPDDTPCAVGFDAVYGCHVPAELQRLMVTLARQLGADCVFTTLGFEEPVVPVERLTRPHSTLYRACTPPDAPY